MKLLATGKVLRAKSGAQDDTVLYGMMKRTMS
jgi:hypothetical protein